MRIETTSTSNTTSETFRNDEEKTSKNIIPAIQTIQRSNKYSEKSKKRKQHPLNIKGELLLNRDFNAITTLKLNGKEPISTETFRKRVKASLDGKRDYIFFIVEDKTLAESDDPYIYDAVAYCSFNNAHPSDLNFATNSPIVDGMFYIIEAEKVRSLEDLANYEIPRFCTLDEFNCKKTPYFMHKISYSDPSIQAIKNKDDESYETLKDRHYIELFLCLDYEFGAGTPVDLPKALSFATEKAMEGNPYCECLLATYVDMGYLSGGLNAIKWRERAQQHFPNKDFYDLFETGLKALRLSYSELS